MNCAYCDTESRDMYSSVFVIEIPGPAHASKEQFSTQAESDTLKFNARHDYRGCSQLCCNWDCHHFIRPRVCLAGRPLNRRPP